MSIEVSSPAFAAGGRIPRRHSREGDDVSPQLVWSGLPPQTQELALICDDPDAPTPEPWVHWVIYKIPAAATGLPEDVPKKTRTGGDPDALQGLNTWDRIGYGGPMPPPGHGVHHYRFRLYALDAPLSLASGADKRSVLEAMSGHILSEGELIGTYER